MIVEELLEEHAHIGVTSRNGKNRTLRITELQITALNFPDGFEYCLLRLIGYFLAMKTRALWSAVAGSSP